MSRSTFRAGLLLLAGAFQFVAVSAAELPEVRVAFGDLDAATQDGALVLYRRIARAASAVAGPEPFARDLAQHSKWNARRELALTQAVQTIGARYHNVLALHAAKARRSPPTQSAERSAARWLADRL